MDGNTLYQIPTPAAPAQSGDLFQDAKSKFATVNQANGLTATPQQTTQPKQDSGNGWADWLPTIGAIAGGLLAPVTGGSSLLAAAALSGLGGAAGQIAANSVEGKDPLETNVLESGLTNAIGGGIGGVLGKVGTKLAGVGSKAAANAADSLIAGQAAKGQVDATLAKTLRTQYGQTNLAKAAQGATTATGKDVGLDSGINTILDNAGNKGLSVNLSSLGKNADNLAGDLVNEAAVNSSLGMNSKSAQIVQDSIEKILQKYNAGAITQVAGKGGKVVSGFDNGVLATQSPLTVKKITSDIGNLAAKWSRSSSPEIQARGQALTYIRNQLTPMLDEATGGVALSTADKGILTKAISELETTNPTMYKALVDKIHTPGITLGEIRSFQAPLIQTKKALENTAKIEGQNAGKNLKDVVLPGAGGAVGFGIGGVPGAVAGYTAGKVAENPAVGAVGAKAFSQLSDLLGSSTATKVIPVLSRIGAIGGTSILNPAVNNTQATDSTLIGAGIPDQGGNMNQVPQQQSQNQLSPLIQSLIMQSMYSLPNGGGNGSTNALASILPTLQKQQAVDSALSSLTGSYNAAGGAQGLTPGGIQQQLLSFIPGTAANAYNTQKEAQAALLANTLGITKEEANNLLPGLLQSQTTANQRLGGLQNILGSLSI